MGEPWGGESWSRARVALAASPWRVHEFGEGLLRVTIRHPSGAEQQIGICRLDGPDGDWIEVVAKIGPGSRIAATTALLINANRLVGHLAIREGYLALRHTVSLSALAPAELVGMVRDLAAAVAPLRAALEPPQASSWHDVVVVD